MNWLSRKQPEKTITGSSLVCGYRAMSDIFVPSDEMKIMYECDWFLDEYSDGSRKVSEKIIRVVTYRESENFKIYGRVLAWERTGTIAKNLIVDLKKFDAEIGQIVEAAE